MFRRSNLFKLILKYANNSLYGNRKSTTATIPNAIHKYDQSKNEENLVYIENPNVFGTLSKKTRNREDTFTDQGDIEEHKFVSEIPLKTQKLTTKQYADLIKQYISHKRLKEAIDILEVRMLKLDKVKPENYIYNILIGACADLGYIKKAFNLYNEMKRRALKPTGDTYTCLFEACVNSPWPKHGLKHAQHLRSLMLEKQIEPNLTNYNAMIKAFGRCEDLVTAFEIVDEMLSKKIKIRVHTFNHLLQACIADKKMGLRHALIVWRKMLRMHEKPNLYTFNLMLKCVKECNLGNNTDIVDLVAILKEHIFLCPSNAKIALIDNINSSNNMVDNPINSLAESSLVQFDHIDKQTEMMVKNNKIDMAFNCTAIISAKQNLYPNLLSKEIHIDEVLALKEVHTVHDKFAVIGGYDGFLKEMELYNVKPDIKTFTQMLPLLSDTEKENNILGIMKLLDIKPDIDFYNILIKNRCLRSDYKSAIHVKDIIKRESEFRKKRYPYNKKLRLNYNIMTYGVLALACNTLMSAEQLLNEMKEKSLKINIEILGTLLKHGVVQTNFDYIIYVLEVTREEKVKINQQFFEHLQKFNKICADRRMYKEGNKEAKPYIQYKNYYNNWLNEVDITNVVESEHPWKQYKESYPDTVQRQNIIIKEPKKFYKPKHKFYVPYVPKL
ncbi:hypothetical protein ACJJTC_014607 [Scirpophaga incertulas]